MKKIILTLGILISSICLTSCSFGDSHTEVYDNINEVFELKADFTSNNDYQQMFDINPSIESSDHILVYRLWAQTDQGDDIWRLIPNNITFDNGDNINYNFDHSAIDISLFVDSNFPLLELNEFDEEDFLFNQIYRVVILKGDLLNDKKIDFSNYNQTIQFLGLQDTPVKKLNKK